MIGRLKSDLMRLAGGEWLVSFTTRDDPRKLIDSLKDSEVTIDLKKYNVFSMICYIGMGWCILLRVPLLIEAVGWGGFWMILLGGVCYTIGAVLYGMGRKKKYMHSVFHLFVVAGSILHTLAVLLYAI